MTEPTTETPAEAPNTPAAEPPVSDPLPPAVAETEGLLRTASADASAPFDPEKFTYPEQVTFSDEDKTFLAETAKEFNIPHAAMSRLVERYASVAQAESDRISGTVQQEWDQTLNGWKAEVQKHYGPKLDEALVRCEGVIDRFGGQKFRDFLDVTGGHSHPAVFEFLEAVHKAVGEGKPVLPNGGSAAPNPFDVMYPTMANMKGNG